MTTPDNSEVRVVVALPSASQLSQDAEGALEMVRAFEVADDACYSLAGEEMNACLKRAAQLNEQRMSLTRPIDESKARIMDLFRGPVSVLEEAARLWRGKMTAYTDAIRRRAEAERLENERIAREERDRLAAEAAALEAANRSGEAEIKRRVADMVVAAPAAVQAAPKVAGVKQRTQTVVEVYELWALACHITGVRWIPDVDKPGEMRGVVGAPHPELLALLEPAMVKVRAHGLSMGEACNTPGIRVRVESAIAGSRK